MVRSNETSNELLERKFRGK